MQLINRPREEAMPEFPVSKASTHGELKTSSIRDLPFGIYKRLQAQISRRRLYPLTLFYTSYLLVILMLVLWTSHPLVGVLFMAAGLPVWTLVEYGFHRFVLHGRFPPGE